MPVISFNSGDVLKKTVVEAGWYQCTLTECTAKSSKEGKSINYWTTFELEGQYTGKEIEVCFNTNTKSRSILGTAQFSPTTDLLEIACAINGMTIPPEGMTVDTDDLISKKLGIQVTKETADGVILNGVTAYMPYDASKQEAKKLQF